MSKTICFYTGGGGGGGGTNMTLKSCHWVATIFKKHSYLLLLKSQFYISFLVWMSVNATSELDRCVQFLFSPARRHFIF